MPRPGNRRASSHRTSRSTTSSPEPTETEPRCELDRFAGAVAAVVQEAKEDPDLLRSAPHSTPVGRVDEVLAARTLDLVWQPKSSAAAHQVD